MARNYFDVIVEVARGMDAPRRLPDLLDRVFAVGLIVGFLVFLYLTA